jgi:hypothetical protein
MRKLARLALEVAALWEFIGPHAALARLLAQAIFVLAGLALEVARVAVAPVLAPVKAAAKQKWIGMPAGGWRIA